jgi:hypothetical protein
MHIVGAGEVYHLERKCSDFFADDFNWDIEQKRLDTDTADFANRYSPDGVPTIFDVNEVQFTDSADVRYKDSESFTF